MTKTKTTDVLASIVGFLEPMESEERMRIINAALVLLGESAAPAKSGGGAGVQDNIDFGSNLGDLPPRARAWMKQHSVSGGELEQVFNVVDGVAEVIASHMPGKSKKEQTYSAYVLTGIAQLIATGNANFSDNDARNVCVNAGCYDSGNHATTMKEKGNEFSGSKDKGWVLTAPGLKRGAELIKELSKSE